jgi:hypothetical protein
MNVAPLVKLHQHKRDDETNGGPFETTQSKIKHPKTILTAELATSTSLPRSMLNASLAPASEDFSQPDPNGRPLEA